MVDSLYTGVNALKIYPASSYFTADSKNHLPGYFSFYNQEKDKVIKAYIKKVIYSNPATIVLWSDGTKTIAKCSEHDTYSPEAGLSICILKKLVGGTTLYNIFADWSSYEDNAIIEVKDVRKNHKK